MTTTRTLWATIALLIALHTPVSAQKSWTPLQKEWFAKIMHFMAAAKKPVPKYNSAMDCAVSNEIIIVVAPCSDNSEKGKAILPKPVQ